MAISYNAADYIDKATALAACDEIEDLARDYRQMGKAVQDCASDFTPEVLSIEGQNLQQSISDTGNSIKDVEIYIEELAQEIRDAIITQYNNLQSKLDAQKAEDEAAAKAKANENQ